MKILYSILLLAWIAFGTYLLRNKICPPSPAKPSASAVSAVAKGGCDVSLAFTDGDMKVKSTRNFSFGSSNHKFKYEIHKDLNTVLIQVAAYLDENPERALLVEGNYLEDEKNSDSENFDNLGLARSAFIKSKLTKDYNISEDQIILGSKMYTENRDVCYDSKGIIRKGASVSFGTRN